VWRRHGAVSLVSFQASTSGPCIDFCLRLRFVWIFLRTLNTKTYFSLSKCRWCYDSSSSVILHFVHARRVCFVCLLEKKTNVSVKKHPVFCLTYEEAAFVGVVGTQILRLRWISIESCRIEAL
jgi:hypothetical protein